MSITPFDQECEQRRVFPIPWAKVLDLQEAIREMGPGGFAYAAVEALLMQVDADALDIADATLKIEREQKRIQRATESRDSGARHEL